MPIITSVNGAKKEINRIIHSVGGTKNDIGKLYHGVEGAKKLVYQSRGYYKAEWEVMESYGVSSISVGNKYKNLPDFLYLNKQNSKQQYIWLRLNNIELKSGDKFIYKYYYNCNDSIQWEVKFYYGNKGNTLCDSKTMIVSGTGYGSGSFTISSEIKGENIRLIMYGGRNTVYTNTFKVYDVYLNNNKVG